MKIFACSVVLGAASVAAAQHVHITVDTFVQEGVPTTLIDAGYNASESAFEIDPTGRLTESGQIAVFRLTDSVMSGGALEGWWAGLAFTLTSDFYFSTGRLDGGDFRFEIAEVDAVSGPAARAAFGTFDGASPVVEADSAGADREGRSFPVGAGSHRHGQFQAVSERGLYDVTLIAWDANGAYADSAPVTIRMNSCAADYDNNGVVDVFDLLAYLDVWFAEGAEADLDQSGGVDVFDLLQFLDGWFAGC
jgi:hypothetical protein